MRTELQTLVDHTLEHAFLSTEYFAEEVTFCPLRGTARTITVKIDQSAETQLTPTGGEEEVDRLEVLVRRDPTHEQGGIDRPIVGDSILRGTARDPDQRPYLYQPGETEDAGELAWRLTFVRARRFSQGAAQ